MKNGRDEEKEKAMGPMFPRLHVNDTEKGGPRAPPRNKMALYEQLSIPSQRFNHGRPPQNGSCKKLVPPASSSQGTTLDKNMSSSLHLAPSVPTDMREKFLASPSNRVIEQKDKVEDEEDFCVPVFVHLEKGQYQSKHQNETDGEELTTFRSSLSGSPVQLQNNHGKDPQVSFPCLSLGKEVGNGSCDNPEGCLSDEVAARATRPRASATCLQQKSETGVLAETKQSGRNEDLTINIEKESTHRLNTDAHAGGLNDGPGKLSNESEYLQGNSCGTLQMTNAERSDDVSGTSVEDSKSCLSISPDAVVGIMGQKHFWKARKAIVNQQRVFAVQVFELHRLIKVQRLIAGSPHLLFEDAAYPLKPSLTVSTAKKLQAGYVVKSQPQILKRKCDSEKPHDKMECSAENAVGKTSLSSEKNGSKPSSYGPYAGNPPMALVTADSKMSPWAFHRSVGQQWLIPVMTPSEGLVYKPYPGPGFSGTPCGGFMPSCPTPMVAGNFMTPNYGVLASNHQGFGGFPSTLPLGYSYFPEYGMSVMNPVIVDSPIEQMNHFSGPVSHAEKPGGEANNRKQHESSCSAPDVATPKVPIFGLSKDSDVQPSAASGPRESVMVDNTDEERVPHFHAVPMIQEGVKEPHNAGQPTRVIKVVPHNPRSATESAARIFQSIQEERNQYD